MSTSARHPEAGEKAWRKVSYSPLFAIACERMFQVMRCFCTFSWGKAYCRAAIDIVSPATGTSTLSVRIPNRPRSLAKERKFYFQAGNLALVTSNRGTSLVCFSWVSPFPLWTGRAPLSSFLLLIEAGERVGLGADSLPIRRMGSTVLYSSRSTYFLFG